MTDTPVSFEASFAELEQVVARLQEGGLTLQESLVLFERGTRLARLCEQELASAELKIRELLSDGRSTEAAPTE